MTTWPACWTPDTDGL